MRTGNIAPCQVIYNSELGTVRSWLLDPHPAGYNSSPSFTTMG
jgi:hypothetical protein